jgi:hypothetical protein
MIVNEFYTAGDRPGRSVIKVADLVEGGRHAERRSHPTGLHTPDNFQNPAPLNIQNDISLEDVAGGTGVG